MKINTEQFSEMSVEEMIFFAKKREYKLSDIYFYLEQHPFTNKKITLQRLSFAIERKNKSFSLIERLFFVISPFGYFLYSNAFYKQEIEEARQYGFDKKIRQYYTYSILGLALYSTLFIIVASMV